MSHKLRNIANFVLEIEIMNDFTKLFFINGIEKDKLKELKSCAIFIL
jgi:hypothetical protein